MAKDHQQHDVSGMDYAEHEKTFSLFAGLIKWGSVASLIIILVAGAATHLLPWTFALVVSALMAFVAAKFV